MSLRLLSIILIVAAGTYCFRYFPLKAGIKKPAPKTQNRVFIDTLFEIAGTSIIAALFVNSVHLPQSENLLPYIIKFGTASAVVIGTGLIRKNAGLSVVSGIITFALLHFFL